MSSSAKPVPLDVIAFLNVDVRDPFIVVKRQLDLPEIEFP